MPLGYNLYSQVKQYLIGGKVRARKPVLLMIVFLFSSAKNSRRVQKWHSCLQGRRNVQKQDDRDGYTSKVKADEKKSKIAFFISQAPCLALHTENQNTIKS